MYCIYTYDWELSDATSYYLEIIAEAIRKTGEHVYFSHNIKEISRSNTIVVINARAFMEVWLRNPRRKIICWFQGIIPEEVRMTLGDSFRVRLRSYGWSALERFALRHAWRVFFVSEAMRNHYINKYKYRPGKEFIMPCFNLQLDMMAFEYSGKYEKPTFVYAGGTDAWQCLEETIQLYKKVEEALAGTHLTLLVRDVERVRKLAKRHGIQNYSISYVKRTQLNKELEKYKYGFLLRKEHIVNNVATPTKFNSYLAAGIIPICTNAIQAFQALAMNTEYCIRLPQVDQTVSNATAIVEFERKNIDPTKIRTDYQRIFDSYYSAPRYIEAIAAMLVAELTNR